MKQLLLVRGSERYIFRYEVGAEDALMDVIMEMAGNKKFNFDHFDAAVLCFRLTGTLIAQAKYYLGESLCPPPGVIEFQNPGA